MGRGGVTFLPTGFLSILLVPSGVKIFEFYVFTDLILYKTSGASGGTIFLLVKKDSGERHAKGLQSRPLETAFIRGFGGETCVLFYVFAQVQFTRFRPVRGVRKRTASTDSCLLRVPSSRYCLRFFMALAARRGKGISDSAPQGYLLRGTEVKNGVPAKAQRQRVWWGKEEQGSERSFCRRQKRR